MVTSVISHLSNNLNAILFLSHDQGAETFPKQNSTSWLPFNIGILFVKTLHFASEYQPSGRHNQVCLSFIQNPDTCSGSVNSIWSISHLDIPSTNSLSKRLLEGFFPCVWDFWYFDNEFLSWNNPSASHEPHAYLYCVKSLGITSRSYISSETSISKEYKMCVLLIHSIDSVH